jgi:hypothetical protein
LVDEGGELGAGGRIEDVANPLFANAIGTELARFRHKLIPDLLRRVQNLPPERVSAACLRLQP